MKSYQCPLCKKIFEHQLSSHTCSAVQLAQVDLSLEQFCSSLGHNFKETGRYGLKHFSRLERVWENEEAYVRYEGYWAIMVCERCAEEKHEFVERCLG